MAITMALVTCGAAMLSPLGYAQETWPSRPLRMVVAFAPGASTDGIARLLAPKLGARLGQPVVVENKGGAGGIIGTDFVAKAPADGYTLLFASPTVITSAAEGKKIPYDPIRDLTPIGTVGAAPFVLIVPPNASTTSLGELIAQARAKPMGFSYGTGGVATITHLGTELFASAAKLQLLHVPYKGVGDALPDLMAGRLQVLLATVAAGSPHIQSGKVRGLAVTSLQRSPLLPDLPTAAESGLPGFQVEAWWGVLGPARLPAPVTKRINEELNVAIALPDIREALAREGATPRAGSPEGFGEMLRAELTRWTRLIKNANIRPQ